MSEITIRSSRGDYVVEVGLGVAAHAAEAAVTVVDPAVESLVPQLAATDPIRFPASEDRKTLAASEELLVEMNRRGLRRGGLVAAVGGGVIQDVATLSCSLYMRGVPWVYIPTTLMAMADSCIGGKSSINAGGVKNLVGNFYPPQRVLVDPVFIAGLPIAARIAGLSEAVKICFARGPESFRTFLASPAALAPGADAETAELIAHVLDSKRWFVEIDEFDAAERRLLNFGHSFGHAWEAACRFAVPHGVGVAVGMLAALRHPSASASAMSRDLEAYVRASLAPLRDLLSAARDVTDAAVFMEALRSDKKNSAEYLRLVLPDEHGELHLRDVPLDDRNLAVAYHCLAAVLEEISA